MARAATYPGRVRAQVWAVPAAAALGLAACSGPADQTAEPDAETITRETADALDTFWTARVPGYQAPAAVRTYREADDPFPATECDAGPEHYIGNSFYCPADQSLFLNLDLLDTLDRSAGSTGPAVMVVAHEWAHHVSLLEGLEARLDIGEELQADCRAGMFVAAVEDGGFTMTLDPGDVDAMLDTLVDLSYQDQSGWFDPGAHGDPFARTQALWIGYETGTESFCDAYVAMEEPIAEVDFDDFAVSFLPSMTIENQSTSQEGYPYARAESAYFDTLTAVAYEVPASSADAVEVFQDVVDQEFTSGDGVTLLDDVTQRQLKEWRGATAVSARYSQNYQGTDVAGIFLVVTEGRGKAALLDIYTLGAAPDPSDESGWRFLEQAADALLRGVDP